MSGPTPYRETPEPLTLLRHLEDAGTPYNVRVAALLDPAAWTDAHDVPPDPTDVDLWVAWVALVSRILRGAGVVGSRAPKDATTLAAVTDMSEGRLLVALAETHGRPDVAELLEEWLGQLHARGPDGRPLHEDPTAPHAVVVRLADRTRRTS